MSNQKKITNFKKHQVIEHEAESLIFLQDLLDDIPRNEKRLEARKNLFAQEHGIPTLKNRELIVVAQKHNLELPEKLQKLIQKRAVRTVSGVSPIGILTKPFECPGKCVYCPTEDRMPKSYMKNQPAAARALRNNFDPFDQVKNRVISLEESGHPTSKLEVIVMGGTWSFLPRGYQNWYISKVFEAANSFEAASPSLRGIEGECSNIIEELTVSVTIRALSKDDWDRVLQLEEQTLAPLGVDDIPQIMDISEFLDFIEEYWVVEYNNEIIGMGGYRKVDGNIAEIKRVRIHPEYQNKNIGQNLIATILKEIEKNNYTEVILDFLDLLSPVNTPFYIKFGFKEYKRETEERGERLFYRKQVKIPLFDGNFGGVEYNKKFLTLKNRRLPYNPSLTQKAQELRRNLTPQEKKLWLEFLSPHKYKFLKQRPIDNYIVDFYCPEKKIIIEIDGESHFTEHGEKYDKKRDEILKSYGLRIIRFTNVEIGENFEGVCKMIEKELYQSIETPQLPPSPPQRGGTQKPLLFLDFDGVISDSYTFVFEKNKQASGEFGKKMSEKDFKDIFHAPNSWQGFLDFGGSSEMLDRYSELERELYSQEVPLFSSILPHLQTLSQYFDLVIVSANQEVVIHEVLKKHHINTLFADVLGRENPGDKSEKILKILKEKNQIPAETIFIGDTISDIKEGKKAGVIAVGAGWGKIFSATELQDAGADFVLETPDDLKNAFGIEERHIEAGEGEGVIREITPPKSPSERGTFNLPPLRGGLGGSKALQVEQEINETASHRIIGLTLETRPDFITVDELVRMRKYGCTRIEIGVQTLDDDVQKLTKRGHTKAQVAKAMKLMKDFGFKVCFHLMPGLPGSNPEKDLEWMKEVFENPDFRPDFIKVYPCMVLPTAELAGIWEKGDFEPISDKELIKLLIKFQAFVPEWTRIMRLMRDIPASNILDGAKFSNLRQILQEQPKKLLEIVGQEFYETHDLANKSKNLFRDIRSREVGFSDIGVTTPPKSPSKRGEKKSPPLRGGFRGSQSHDENIPKLTRRDYEASGGKEVFLSFESHDEAHLYALLRLRKPSGQSFDQHHEFQEVFENSAFIREVHSYGSEISVGDDADNSTGQHKGFGRKLIEEAERIARDEWGLKKMTIIAGVGTREYYRKWGYEEKVSYMVKNL